MIFSGRHRGVFRTGRTPFDDPTVHPPPNEQQGHFAGILTEMGYLSSWRLSDKLEFLGTNGKPPGTGRSEVYRCYDHVGVGEIVAVSIKENGDTFERDLFQRLALDSDPLHAHFVKMYGERTVERDGIRYAVTPREWIPGRVLSDPRTVIGRAKFARLAEDLARSLVLTERLSRAIPDPHPGNILYDGNRLVFIDLDVATPYTLIKDGEEIQNYVRSYASGITPEVFLEMGLPVSEKLSASALATSLWWTAERMGLHMKEPWLRVGRYIDRFRKDPQNTEMNAERLAYEIGSWRRTRRAFITTGVALAAGLVADRGIVRLVSRNDRFYSESIDSRASRVTPGTPPASREMIQHELADSMLRFYAGQFMNGTNPLRQQLEGDVPSVPLTDPPGRGFPGVSPDFDAGPAYAYLLARASAFDGSITKYWVKLTERILDLGRLREPLPGQGWGLNTMPLLCVSEIAAATGKEGLALGILEHADTVAKAVLDWNDPLLPYIRSLEQLRAGVSYTSDSRSISTLVAGAIAQRRLGIGDGKDYVDASLEYVDGPLGNLIDIDSGIVWHDASHSEMRATDAGYLALSLAQLMGLSDSHRVREYFDTASRAIESRRVLRFHGDSGPVVTDARALDYLALRAVSEDDRAWRQLCLLQPFFREERPAGFLWAHDTSNEYSLLEEGCLSPGDPSICGVGVPQADAALIAGLESKKGRDAA